KLRCCGLKININGIDIDYSVNGEGNPVLLLHGWGSNKEVYKNITELLCDRYKVYALDFPGCGESGLPESPLQLEDYENLVLEFCSKLDINNPVIMGHSHGGRVALSLLGTRKLKAAKAVLFDSAGVVIKKSFKVRAKIKTFKALKKCLSLSVFDDRRDELVGKAQRFFGSADYSAAPEVMRKTMVNVVNRDLTPVLSNIDCPVLLIWGENDGDTPLACAKIMEKNIKDCGLCVLSGCTHYSFLQKPYDTAAILNSFLG
ncbi:MAG: alpha/beta hydrolase, partial [Oscillospiraceae bacterium]|nr:alpha/beta hydrolase [Candidatus Equicaccousia limihippi]